MTRTFLALAVAGALVPPAAAQVAATTLPTGGSVVAGTAAISTPAAGSMVINQATSSAILNWQSFSIGSSARVQFAQPSASAVALNRVIGTDPSQIFGQLAANGRVFLTNPAGVLFAPGASVDVGSLMATTLSISNTDFLSGRYTFTNSGGAGQVVNQGTIQATGYAALAAPQVRNDGIIIARLGKIALGAGDTVALDMVGDSLVNIRVDQGALNASIVNTGTLEADGGVVILNANSVNGLLDTVINTTGVIRADTIGQSNGQIVLNAGVTGSATLTSTGGLTVNSPSTTTSGAISVGAGSITSSGGSISLAAGSLSVAGTSNVTATGGAITLNATSVALTSEEKVTAPGGTVVVKGDTVTVADRSVVAIAGAQVTNRRAEARTNAAAGAAVVQLPRIVPAEGSPVGRTTQVIDQSVRAPVGRLPRMAFQIQGLGVSLPPQ